MEIGQSCGKPAYLIDGPHELRPEWFDNCEVVAITAGASIRNKLCRSVSTTWSIASGPRSAK